MVTGASGPGISSLASQKFTSQTSTNQSQVLPRRHLRQPGGLLRSGSGGGRRGPPGRRGVALAFLFFLSHQPHDHLLRWPSGTPHGDDSLGSGRVVEVPMGPLTRNVPEPGNRQAVAIGARQGPRKVRRRSRRRHRHSPRPPHGCSGCSAPPVVGSGCGVSLALVLQRFSPRISKGNATAWSRSFTLPVRR